MKNVGLIARRELRGYFSTFSGYLILAAHLLLSGLLFNVFAVGNRAKLSQQVLEDFFYLASGMAIITAVLLSIRLIAEERQIQTFVLLRTAPVSYVVAVRQTSVLFAVVLSVLLLRERPSPGRVIGIALTVVGVALVALYP